MIKIENQEVVGFEHAIKGMRNPMNSWDKSDSFDCRDISCEECPVYDLTLICPHQLQYVVGDNDLTLMKKLAAGGPVHAKYRRMIVVYLDITAPLYWWKEYDTYKIGTVANSCSTMHKIHDKEFTLDDFSTDHLIDFSWNRLDDLIQHLNICRNKFIETKDKDYWWQIIQLLPSSYNQKRTVMLNYEVLNNMYHSRKFHKLDEWRTFCDFIEKLPYSELITGKDEE